MANHVVLLCSVLHTYIFKPFIIYELEVTSRLSCAPRSTIINASRSTSGLEDLRNKTINDVRDTLYKHSQVSSPSRSCQMRIVTAGFPRSIPVSPDIRITELDVVDIVANYPHFPVGGGRGLYDPHNGKTILCRERWCIETLIHETLHSLSFSSVRPDLRRTFLNLFEGLTEFFAGYVMSCRYPDCYQAWKEERYTHCSITYIPLVRLWAAFCRFIPMSELVKVYLWEGTKSWEARCSDFLGAIHQAGYPNFDDFVRHRQPTVDTKILEECLKNFGRRKFRSIYESPLANALDFNQILCSSLPLASF